MKKILIFGFLILLGIACSQATPGTGTSSSATPTPTITLTPTPSPAQILIKAGDAIMGMKSARFRLLREGDPVEFDPTTGMAFSEASGEYLAPDRVHAKVKVAFFGNVLEMEIYWLPEGVFISNPITLRFEPAPADIGLNGPALFQANGMPAVLKTGIQNPSRIGNEAIEGVDTIHIAGKSDGAALAPLTAGALQSGTLYPVDVWVDRSTFIPVRLHIAEPDGSGWMIDLYDINAEIEIALP
ncbi:MAG: LppX_LprAFG lipoprotein [Anaerolineales bacterium]